MSTEGINEGIEDFVPLSEIVANGAFVVRGKTVAIDRLLKVIEKDPELRLSFSRVSLARFTIKEER